MAPFRREGQGNHQQRPSKLRSATHDMIGLKLRLHYEELQQQPLPRRLAELMKRLDGADGTAVEPRRK